MASQPQIVEQGRPYRWLRCWPFIEIFSEKIEPTHYRLWFFGHRCSTAGLPYQNFECGLRWPILRDNGLRGLSLWGDALGNRKGGIRGPRLGLISDMDIHGYDMETSATKGHRLTSSRCGRMTVSYALQVQDSTHDGIGSSNCFHESELGPDRLSATVFIVRGTHKTRRSIFAAIQLSQSEWYIPKF